MAPGSPTARPRRRLPLLEFFVLKLIEDAAIGLSAPRRPAPLTRFGREVLGWVHRSALGRVEKLRLHAQGSPALPALPRRRLGVAARATFVVDYDPVWPASFSDEASLIREFLGNACVGIHHVGSTSIPGLRAKPIIDIAVELLPRCHDEELDLVVSLLAKLGYRYLGYRGSRGGHFLEKTRDSARTHAIQLHPAGAAELAAMIRFRDLLRSHPGLAADYGHIKGALAAAVGGDRRIYVWYKSHWIDHQMRGLLEAGHAGWGAYFMSRNPPTLLNWYLRRPPFRPASEAERRLAHVRT